VQDLTESVATDLIQWFLIGAANSFVGRLKPLDDRNRRCPGKSLREIRGLFFLFLCGLCELCGSVVIKN
jgi:hypothetical protein